MSEISVQAFLPFSLRVGPNPYKISIAASKWQITVERVKRRPLDERIAMDGDFDLTVDRYGLVTYSRVTGQTEWDKTPSAAVPSFLEALNALIDHFRDEFEFYWVRRLEIDDLFRLEVLGPDGGASLVGGGRTGGFTLPNLGLTDEAHERLQAALSGCRRPPIWRQLELNAEDALSQGRYEEAVLLAWSALEAACRNTLPGLAWGQGLGVADLEEELQSRQRKRHPARSLEEAVERSTGLRWLRVAAKLAHPGTFDIDSLTSEVNEAYRLRNRIIHSGVRIESGASARAVKSCRFILRNLNLRIVNHPPADIAWREYFGEVCPEISRFIEESGSRLVLFNPARTAGTLPGWRLERIDRDWRLSIPSDMEESAAAAQVITEADSWTLRADPQSPRIRWDAGNVPSLLPGLSSTVASVVELAVWHSYAMRKVGASAIGVDILADYALCRSVSLLAGSISAYDSDDIRQITVPIQLAAYASVLDDLRTRRHVAELYENHGRISDRIIRWSNLLRSGDGSDRHSACDVFRSLHHELFWLDSFVVECPIEAMSYGSSARPFRFT